MWNSTVKWPCEKHRERTREMRLMRHGSWTKTVQLQDEAGLTSTTTVTCAWIREDPNRWRLFGGVYLLLMLYPGKEKMVFLISVRRIRTHEFETILILSALVHRTCGLHSGRDTRVLDRKSLPANMAAASVLRSSAPTWIRRFPRFKVQLLIGDWRQNCSS